MTGGQRDRRLSEAADLKDAVDALYKVSPEQRLGFLHDRICLTIDDLCAKKKRNGSATFTAEQVHVLKDIAFQIVYVLDSESRTPRTLPGKLRREFSQLSLMAKISAGAAALAFLLGTVNGAISALEKGRELYGKMSASPSISSPPSP